jgi:hypothetical protein
VEGDKKTSLVNEGSFTGRVQNKKTAGNSLITKLFAAVPQKA